MNRLAKFAPVIAMAIGPTAAWLVWAVQNRRPVQIWLAIAANVALWFAGPVFVAWTVSQGIL